MNINNSNLEFRKIPSLKFLYEVNENGTIIRNVKSKKQLRIILDESGQYVTYIGDRKVMIHEIVAECWLGDCQKINHVDGNLRNNNFRNLSLEPEKKPVILIDQEGNEIKFDSRAEASRWLSQKYGKTFDAIRFKFKAHRSHIFDYDVKYF